DRECNLGLHGRPPARGKCKGLAMGDWPRRCGICTPWRRIAREPGEAEAPGGCPPEPSQDFAARLVAHRPDADEHEPSPPGPCGKVGDLLLGAVAEDGEPYGDVDVPVAMSQVLEDVRGSDACGRRRAVGGEAGDGSLRGLDRGDGVEPEIVGDVARRL